MSAYGLPLDPKSRIIPPVLKTLVEYFEQSDAYKHEGIFRVSGRHEEIRELKDKFNKGEIPNLDNSDPHVIAVLLKQFFIELPVPLLTFELYDCFLAAAAVPHVEAIYQSIRSVLKLLPIANLIVIDTLARFLKKVSDRAESNKMGATNLAIVFAPSLLRPMEETIDTAMNDSKYATRLMELFIAQTDQFFDPVHFSELYEVKRQSGLFAAVPIKLPPNANNNSNNNNYSNSNNNSNNLIVSNNGSNVKAGSVPIPRPLGPRPIHPKLKQQMELEMANPNSNQNTNTNTNTYSNIHSTTYSSSPLPSSPTSTSPQISPLNSPPGMSPTLSFSSSSSLTSPLNSPRASHRNSPPPVPAKSRPSMTINSGDINPMIPLTNTPPPLPNPRRSTNAPMVPPRNSTQQIMKDINVASFNQSNLLSKSHPNPFSAKKNPVNSGRNQSSVRMSQAIPRGGGSPVVGRGRGRGAPIQPNFNNNIGNNSSNNFNISNNNVNNNIGNIGNNSGNNNNNNNNNAPSLSAPPKERRIAPAPENPTYQSFALHLLRTVERFSLFSTTENKFVSIDPLSSKPKANFDYTEQNWDRNFEVFKPKWKGSCFSIKNNSLIWIVNNNKEIVTVSKKEVFNVESNSLPDNCFFYCVIVEQDQIMFKSKSTSLFVNISNDQSLIVTNEPQIFKLNLKVAIRANNDYFVTARPDAEKVLVNSMLKSFCEMLLVQVEDVNSICSISCFGCKKRRTYFRTNKDGSINPSSDRIEEKEMYHLKVLGNIGNAQKIAIRSCENLYLRRLQDSLIFDSNDASTYFEFTPFSIKSPTNKSKRMSKSYEF